MDLYEYQGKELLGRFGIPVSAGRLRLIARRRRGGRPRSSAGRVVVKAQVLTGGRGKAGGVKLAGSPAEAAARAAEILGLEIRGHPVGGSGSSRPPRSRASTTSRRLSTAAAQQALLMFTTAAGSRSSRSRRRARKRSSASTSTRSRGTSPTTRESCSPGSPTRASARRLEAIAAALYRCFVESDATLCEINPLIVTPEGEVRALDAKVTIDDSALFRHPELADAPRSVARPTRSRRSPREEASPT